MPTIDDPRAREESIHTMSAMYLRLAPPRVIAVDIDGTLLCHT